MISTLKTCVLAGAVLFTGLAFGQAQKGQSWTFGVTSDKEGLYAGTVNDSGAVFGQYCYPDEGESGVCYWVLANDVNCDKGSSYPLLVNSDAGAYSFEGYCFKQEGVQGRFAFTDFDKVDQIVRAGGRIAIAFPLASGLFQVNRFNLDGAARAVNTMRSRAEKASSERRTTTKDKYL